MQGHPGTEAAEEIFGYPDVDTVDEAAERLKVSRSTLLRMIHGGRLAKLGVHAVRPGRDWKIIRADLDAYLASGQMTLQAPVRVLVRIEDWVEALLREGIDKLGDPRDPLVIFAENLIGQVEGQPASETRSFTADETVIAVIDAHRDDAAARLRDRHPLRDGLGALTTRYLQEGPSA